MKWLRVRRLKPLCLALLCLALAPPLIEFGLRVAAVCDAELSDSGLTVVPSWQMHHQMQPLQQKQLLHGETGQPVTLRTNSLGLRGLEPELPGQSYSYRILCLGDETLLAAELAESETLPHRLLERLTVSTRENLEPINAGVPGYCPLLSYLQYRHQLMALKPDLIILFFDMSDVAEDLRYRRFTEIESNGRPLASIHPSLTQSEQSKSLQDSFMSWKLAQEQLCQVFSDQPPEASRRPVDPRTQYAWLTDDSTAFDRFVELALSPIEKLQRLAHSQGIDVLLAAAPAPWQVSGRASPGARQLQRNGIARGQVVASRRPFALLREFATRQNLPFCDASPAFMNARQPENLYQQNTRGFTAAGTELYAAQIIRTLRENMSGPWQREPDHYRHSQPPNRERHYPAPYANARGDRPLRSTESPRNVQIPTEQPDNNGLVPVSGDR